MNLGSNGLGDEGARSLAGVIGQCSSLAMLDLSHCEIGDEGARSLADGARQCSKLTVLDLSYNDDVAAEVIASIRTTMREKTVLFAG